MLNRLSPSYIEAATLLKARLAKDAEAVAPYRLGGRRDGGRRAMPELSFDSIFDDVLDICGHGDEDDEE